MTINSSIQRRTSFNGRKRESWVGVWSTRVRIVIAACVGVVSLGARAAPPVPELLYYKFDETGTIVTNRASSPPPGTASASILGGIAQNQPNETLGNVTALRGSGLSASTDYLNTGWVTNLSGSWTISFASRGISTSGTLYFVMGDFTAQSLRIFTNGVAGSTNWILRGTGLADTLIPGGALAGTTTVNTFVYDSAAGNIRAYLNGALVSTVAQTALSFAGTGPFKVMGYASNAGAPLGGLLGDVRIYSRALNASEVEAISDAVLLLPQAITNFAPVSPVAFGAVPQILSATGSASGIPVTFRVISGPCLLSSGNVLAYFGVGTCVVAANQARNANYAAAPEVTANVVVEPIPQNITGFNPTSPVALGALAQTLSAVGGTSGNPVTFTLISGPCSLSGNSLSYIGGGRCVVAANQAGNVNYAAAVEVRKDIRVIPSLNIDASSASDSVVDPATDGAMILRYLAGFTGEAITQGAMHGTATRTSAEIGSYLVTIRGALDVNADARFDLTIDGLLIVRYMLGLRAATGLFNGIDVGTSWTPSQVEAYLSLLMP